MKWIIILLALSLSSAGTAGAGQAPEGGFCARMAGPLGMTPAKAASGKSAYEARALKGLDVALFGGTASVSMMLKPPTSGDMGDPARFATACNAVANGLRCDVSGPALFEIAVGDRIAATEARAGDAAQVTMIKNRVRCEDR